MSFSHKTEAHPSARSLGEPFQLKLFDILSFKSEYYDVPWGLFRYESGDNYWHFLIQEFASFVITKCVYCSVVRVAFQFRSDVGWKRDSFYGLKGTVIVEMEWNWMLRFFVCASRLWWQQIIKFWYVLYEARSKYWTVLLYKLFYNNGVNTFGKLTSCFQIIPFYLCSVQIACHYEVSLTSAVTTK